MVEYVFLYCMLLEMILWVMSLVRRDVQSVEKVLLSVVSMLAGDPVFIIVLTSLLHFPLNYFICIIYIN